MELARCRCWSENPQRRSTRESAALYVVGITSASSEHLSDANQRIDKGLCLVPCALVEQIVMGPLRKEFNPFWLVSCAIDLPAHFRWDHRVLHPVQDKNRRFDQADVVFVVEFVRNQQAERQPKIGAPCHIDRRSEWSF